MLEPYVVRIPAVSIRSLTSRVFPDSGPGFASSGSSTQLMTALSGSLADDGNRLDLDLRARDRQPAHLDERARGTCRTERLLTHGIDLRPVVDVGQEDRHLRHVGKRDRKT